MAERLFRRAFLRKSVGAVLAVWTLLGVYVYVVRAQEAGAGTGAVITSAIDASQVGTPVSKYIYGMFIEHIGSLIYRSLWSEMLDDRKFYIPISSQDPKPAGQAQGGPMRNMQLRKWRPVGPDESVVMDKDQPFVGD